MMDRRTTDRRVADAGTTEGGGMTCEQALEAAALAAAGEVSAPAGERLEAHLAGCAACRAEVGLMRHALDLLRAGETPDPGADYWRTFDARLRVRILRERSVRRWRSIASVAAAALVVAGILAWSAGRRAPAGPAVRASALPEGAVSGGAARGPEAIATADEAEARLEEVIDRLALQEQGERSFESVLDEVLPAAPPGLEGDMERADADPALAPDNC